MLGFKPDFKQDGTREEARSVIALWWHPTSRWGCWKPVINRRPRASNLLEVLHVAHTYPVCRVLFVKERSVHKHRKGYISDWQILQHTNKTNSLQLIPRIKSDLTFVRLRLHPVSNFLVSQQGFKFPSREWIIVNWCRYQFLQLITLWSARFKLTNGVSRCMCRLIRWICAKRLIRLRYNNRILFEILIVFTF